MPPQPDKQQQALPAKCKSCHGPMDSPAFCDNCRSLYPADGLSHFELLGFRPTYEIDAAVLRQKYLQVSRGVHPDHHGESGSTLSLRLSAQLNEAHRVLADPVLRAEYLLELFGGSSATTDKSVPPDVLSTTLALREEIQEAHAAGDNETLDACGARAREVYDQTLTAIGGLARQLPADDSLRRRLRSVLNASKYYQKLLTEHQADTGP